MTLKYVKCVKILQLEELGQPVVLCYFVTACIKWEMRLVGQKGQNISDDETGRA